MTSQSPTYQAGLSGRVGAPDPQDSLAYLLDVRGGTAPDPQDSLAYLLMVRGGTPGLDDVNGGYVRRVDGTRRLRRGSARQVRKRIPKTATEDFRDHAGLAGFDAYKSREIISVRPRDHAGTSGFNDVRGGYRSKGAFRTTGAAVEVEQGRIEDFRDHSGMSGYDAPRSREIISVRPTTRAALAGPHRLPREVLTSDRPVTRSFLVHP